MKKISIDELNAMLEEKSEYELSDKSIKQSTAHKGKTLSNEHKKFLSEREITEETKLKIAKARKDKPLSEEHKTKISHARLGKTSGMKGKTSSDDTKIKLSKAHSMPCTIDGALLFESRKQLIAKLGQGCLGSRHPNFRYVTKEEYEAWLKNQSK